MPCAARHKFVFHDVAHGVLEDTLTLQARKYLDEPGPAVERHCRAVVGFCADDAIVTQPPPIW